MAKHNNLGMLGEEIAQNYLAEHSFFIVATNWRTGSLELDVVATKNNVLHIVEVKTRQVEVAVVASDFSVHNSLTPQKLERIMNAANIYVEQNNFQGLVSIDFLAIETYGDGTFRVEFTEGVQW